MIILNYINISYLSITFESIHLSHIYITNIQSMMDEQISNYTASERHVIMIDDLAPPPDTLNQSKNPYRTTDFN